MDVILLSLDGLAVLAAIDVDKMPIGKGRHF